MKGLVKKKYVVKQLLLQYWVNFNKVNSRTYIEQLIKDNIFQLQNEFKTLMEEWCFWSSWRSVAYN